MVRVLDIHKAITLCWLKYNIGNETTCKTLKSSQVIDYANIILMLMSSEHTQTCAKSEPKGLKRKKIVQKNESVRVITYT